MTSTFVYLQGEPSACSIEVAYQAAEANHPGLGREGSPLKGQFAGRDQAILVWRRRIVRIGRASPQETLTSAYRPRQPNSPLHVFEVLNEVKRFR